MEDRDRADAEDIVRAIRRGEVDAFVVQEATEEKIYSLRSADLLYRAMIEEMKDGAVALDPSGLIVYCNAFFAQLVKAERRALVGAKIFPFAPGETEGFFAALSAPPNGTTGRELELRAMDGTAVPVLAVMNRIGLGDDSHVYCLIVTDLRDQKRREQLVIEGRRKDEFLAMLAHELRNPIAPIRYAAARLRSGEPTPARLEWAREVINRQVDQLTRLVDDLLDVSRITRGKISLNLQPIAVDTIIASAVEAVRPIVEARKQDLKVTRPAERLMIKGDPTRLAQVVSNLLNNAAKFTPERGQISISVEAERNDDRPAWVRIIVTDNGVGIRSNLVPEMFNLFAQADENQGRAQGGLGIGLTLVRSFVEMHGGTVEGYSDGPGRGSTFVVRLPLQAAAAGRPALQDDRMSSVAAGVVPRKILVVDDNVDVAESLSGFLSDCGHDVRVAQTGELALEQAQAFRPDVMFIDVALPGMNGHEAARRIRSTAELQGTTLVAVTGYGQEEDRRRSRQAGFDHHWVKPLQFDALTELLASLDAKRAGPA